MRRVAVLGLVSSLVVACSSTPSGVTATDVTTTSTSTPVSDGFTHRGIRCGADRFEDEVRDYGSDAVGHETIEDAIEAFQGEDTWRLREDWHGLIQLAASSSPVEFTDERGWVYLAVYLDRFNNSWIVGGFASCQPPDS